MPFLGKSGTSRIIFFKSSMSTSNHKRGIGTRQGQIIFDNFSNPRHPRPLFQYPLEGCERRFVGFGVHFNIARRKIAHVTLYSQPFCGVQREVTVSDALHTAANKIVSRGHNCNGGLMTAATVYDAKASLALFQAVMPPTTFEIFRKPSCSSTLVAIEER